MPSGASCWWFNHSCILDCSWSVWVWRVSVNPHCYSSWCTVGVRIQSECFGLSVHLSSCLSVCLSVCLSGRTLLLESKCHTLMLLKLMYYVCRFKVFVSVFLYLSLSTCLPVSVHLFLPVSVHLSSFLYLSVFMSVFLYLSVHQSVFLYLPVLMSVFLYLSVLMSVFLSSCLSSCICLSSCLSSCICLSSCLSSCLPVSACPHVCLHVCLPVSVSSCLSSCISLSTYLPACLLCLALEEQGDPRWGIEPTLSASQPNNAIPLGQTGSRWVGLNHGYTYVKMWWECFGK